MRIFISHARRDGKFASQLAEALEADGHAKVWTDRDILPGDNFASAIATALDRAEALIVLLSPEALASDFVKSEWEYALGRERFQGRLIPVEIRPTPNKPWIFDKLSVLSGASPREAAKLINSRLLSIDSGSRTRASS